MKYDEEPSMVKQREIYKIVCTGNYFEYNDCMLLADFKIWSL